MILQPRLITVSRSPLQLVGPRLQPPLGYVLQCANRVLLEQVIVPLVKPWLNICGSWSNDVCAK